MAIVFSTYSAFTEALQQASEATKALHKGFIPDSVMEFCVKELSKENHVTDTTMPPSERRCKQPAAWAPISALIWHDKELCPAQIRIMMGFKDIRTAYRNLQDMEEAGLLKHRYKDGNKQTKWYFNV